MIVLKSTYDALKKRFARLDAENDKLIATYNELVREWKRVRKERDQNIEDYNNLVDKANDLREQLRAAKQTKQTNTQFTSDELRAIRRLCHPDRHGNSEAATKITQKLNGMV